METKEITKEMCRLIRKDIDATLELVASKYGLGEITLGNIRFDKTHFTSKITARVSGAEGEAFLTIPHRFLGRVFTFKGHTYTVTGYNPRRPKFCMQLICNENGKISACPEAMVDKYTSGI